MFTVCDSKTGYVLCTEVYSGNGQQDNSITELFQRLLSGYLDKGHTVFMDRFYNTPARKAKTERTCIPNQKELPRQNVVSKKLKRDECVFT